MTLKQFKWLDLLLFSLVGVIFEVANKFACVNLDQFSLIFMSFTIVLTLISIYRWGFFGVIVLVFSKFISVVISDHRSEFKYYVVYIAGGMLGVLLGYLIFQKLIGKKKIKNTFLILTYLYFDFAASILFESLIFSFFDMNNFNETFILNLKALFIQESMSIFTSTIILLVANRKKGNIIIEMRQYVKDVHDLKKLGGLKEMKESPNFNSDSPYTEFNQIDDSTILDGGTMNVDQLKELEEMFNATNKCDKIKNNNSINDLIDKGKKEKDVQER